MKLVFALLVVLPLAFCAPEKRFLLSDIQNLFDKQHINDILQQVYNTLGADATEQSCEKECMIILNNDLLDTGCPLVCHSFQTYVKTLQGAQPPAAGPSN